MFQRQAAGRQASRRAITQLTAMDDAKTILLVEDERQLREAVATALECEGFSVYQAGTAGHAAIEAGARRPDLVILDLGLPDRSVRRGRRASDGPYASRSSVIRRCWSKGRIRGC